MPSRVTYSIGFQQDALQIVCPKVLQPAEIFQFFGDVHPESQTLLHFIIFLRLQRALKLFISGFNFEVTNCFHNLDSHFMQTFCKFESHTMHFILTYQI